MPNRRDILTRVSALAPSRSAEPTRNESPRFRVEASADTTDVYIYDEIGGWFGVWASELVPELVAIGTPQIAVHLNSPGGDYFDGVAIANALSSHAARVTIHVDGLAASAASVIAMSGDEIVMHPGSQMMIHDALTRTTGNATELRQTAELLDSVSQGIAELYAARAGGEAGEWRTAMRAETWYSPAAAVEAGLADRVATLGAGQGDSAEPQNKWRELLATWRDAPKTPEAAPAAPVFNAEHFRTAIQKGIGK